MRQVVEPEFEDDDDYDVAPKARSSSSPAAPGGFMDSIRTTAAGRPLEPAVRARMERGFGHSLGGVRVHADGASARLSDAIDARAFTHGRDIFFGSGEYAPGTGAGDRLLAHELAHTLQQAPAGTLARQPKDPKRMTDAEKARERDRIRDLTQELLDRLRNRFDAAKKEADAAGRKVVDPAKRQRERDDLTPAIESARRIQDDRQRSVRLGFLEAEARLLDTNDFYAWLLTQDKVVMPGDAKTFARIGNPNVKFKDEELATFADATAAIGRGVDTYLFRIYLPAVYKEEMVNPADLATDEASAAEAAGSVGSRSPGSAPGAFDPTGTVEDRELLQELVTALGDLVTGEPGSYDQAALLAELRKLDPGARQDFYAWVHTMVKPGAPPDPAAKGLPRLLEVFNKLDPAAREAMKVNREIREKQPGASEAIPETVRLQLEGDVAEEKQAGDAAQAIADDLDRIRGKVLPPDLAKELSGFSFGVQPFFNETAMFIGLLGGARERSDAVKGVVNELMVEVITFRRELMKKLARYAAESAILTGVSVATKGAGALLFGWRLRRVLKALTEIKKDIERLQRAYDVVRKVEKLIAIIKTVRNAAPGLISWYDEASAEYARLQKLLDTGDAGETLDEAVEQQEEALLERLDDRLEGALGTLLDELYLPDDATPDDLRQILLDIPLGIKALESMWDYYGDTGEKDKPHFANVLSVRAFQAGHYLFPFVGVLAALAARALQAEFPKRGLRFSHNEKILKSAGTEKGRRERHRKRFAVLSRKRYKPEPSALPPWLPKGRKDLEDAIGKYEPGPDAGEHWTRPWFKKAVRREIKKVNLNYRGEMVPGRATSKKGAPPGPTEPVPLPKFRVRLRKPTAGKLAFIIKLNPEETSREYDELSLDDFKDNGVEYTGDEERKEHVRRFLRRKKYHVLPHPKDAGKEFVRLHEGRSDTPEHPFMLIAGDRIKVGFDPDAYKAFLGVTVSDDHHLPEGYHLQTTQRGVHIQIKHGVAKKGLEKQLSLGPNRILQEGAAKPLPETLRPAALKPPTTEAYDYVAAVNTTLAEPQPGAPRFKEQRKRPIWDREIATQEFLRRRTTDVGGVLGYTIRARALGDDLPNRHLPELREGDDKGHLVARRFGSPKDDPYWNLVPMLTRENQFPGRWYKLEAEIAEYYVGKKGDPANSVEFGISLIYPGRATRRPRSRDDALAREEPAGHVDRQRREAKDGGE